MVGGKDGSIRALRDALDRSEMSDSCPVKAFQLILNQNLFLLLSFFSDFQADGIRIRACSLSNGLHNHQTDLTKLFLHF